MNRAPRCKRSAFHLRGIGKVEIMLLCSAVCLFAMAAIPNFVELRTLSDVARAKRDLGAIAAAMESYRTDNLGYPPNGYDSPLPGLTRTEIDQRLLTTPVAYMPGIPVDKFRLMANVGAQYPLPTSYTIYAVAYTSRTIYPGYYRSLSKYPKTAWNSWSIGPDWVTNTDGYRPFGRVLLNESTYPPGMGVDRNGFYIGASGSYFGMRYDPTNGLVSWGDLYKFGGDSVDRIN